MFSFPDISWPQALVIVAVIVCMTAGAISDSWRGK